jgi:hypothetical protein
VTQRSLAELGQGARGRIVELRLPPELRTLPSSPLRPGASVYVAEAAGGRWLHVRIESREYSIPLGVAERVLVEVPERGPPPRPLDSWAVLLSRLDRRSWRVRVVDRASGVVARSEWFEEEPAARRRFEQLLGDADTLDGASFRSRYRLP